MTTVHSTPQQLDEIEAAIRTYLRLPFSDETIPGRMMESILSHVRSGDVLKTYDFVDVVSDNLGWQVKSTKLQTPVTWKRAKIADSEALIRQSRRSRRKTQQLGNDILELCNQHVQESIEKYELDSIGYARLIVDYEAGTITYFEREIASRDNPVVFPPGLFRWEWSKPKKTVKKQQLPALHGFSRDTGKKWFAWHGRGENQLHFTGEASWWPDREPHFRKFDFPSPNDRLSWGDLYSVLDSNLGR